VVAHSHESLGDDARMSLNARLWLGIALRCGGDPKLAAAHIDAAASGLTRGFGQDSSDALAGRLARALNQLALGQFTDGRVAALEVLAAYRERLRPDHPLALICALNVAVALCLEGDYPAARTQVELAADGLTVQLGSDHPHTLAANMTRASVLAGVGRLEEAAAVEELVLAERTRVLGPQHPDTVRSHANLLLTLRQRGITDPAAERQHVIAELIEQLGAGHPDVAEASVNHRLFCGVNPLPF
jgi:hypothetical protein